MSPRCRCASGCPAWASTCPSSRASCGVRGNRRDYPLCDVAQYWTIYDLPGAPGHDLDLRARTAGHVPALLLRRPMATDGNGLIGKLVTAPAARRATAALPHRRGQAARPRPPHRPARPTGRAYASSSRPARARRARSRSCRSRRELTGARRTDERAPRATAAGLLAASSGPDGGDGRPGARRHPPPAASIGTVARTWVRPHRSPSAVARSCSGGDPRRLPRPAAAGGRPPAFLTPQARSGPAPIDRVRPVPTRLTARLRWRHRQAEVMGRARHSDARARVVRGSQNAGRDTAGSLLRPGRPLAAARDG